MKKKKTSPKSKVTYICDHPDLGREKELIQLLAEDLLDDDEEIKVSKDPKEHECNIAILGGTLHRYFQISFADR